MTIEKGPILIMAGGTGGHVFPALAIAKIFINRDISVVWLGTRKGLEARIVPAAGIPIEWLTITGLRGKGIFALIAAPVNLFRACVQAFLILNRIKPKLIIGMGGFASGPGGLMAALMNKPLVIHEQNAIAGMTNRVLSKFADLVLEAFPGTFKQDIAALEIGNPVRDEIKNITVPKERLNNRKAALRLLVLGGSLGAKALNELLPAAIKTIPSSLRPVVRHQAGNQNIESLLRLYSELKVEHKVYEFIDDMAESYAWADLIVCRAGAMTVSELAAAGAASILIPYPYAVDDHQTANAQYLTESGAAILLQQSKTNGEVLGDLISALSVDRERLLSMACAARKLGKPNATQSIVNQCLILAGELDNAR